MQYGTIRYGSVGEEQEMGRGETGKKGWDSGEEGERRGGGGAGRKREWEGEREYRRETKG